MDVRALRNVLGGGGPQGEGGGTGGPKSRRRRYAAASATAVAAVVLAAAFSCGGTATTASPHVATRADFLVSYAGAAGRLDGLQPSERDEQLRDWTRTALAAHLGLDTAGYRDASFDTLPVRDDGFSDLADQQVGPGRSLVDRSGVLHLLVERGDPHEDRTVGLLLDQYRTDHGADPALVEVHHFTVDKNSDTVSVTADQPASTAEVRTAHGYVSMPVPSAADLSSFLAKAGSLSELSVRDGTIWLDGWHWPDVPSVPLTAQDVTVLQKGYVSHVTDGNPAPGFSLDPLPLKTAADVEAAIPGLAPDLAAAVASGKWAGTGFTSADDLQGVIEQALYGDDSKTISLLPQAGIPSDRTRLWSLDSALNHAPVTSQARYDGGLAGTDVGMTLFYTDYVTKNWVAGVGTGVPTDAVGGFVPDSAAATPWSQCRGAKDAKEETGRLWFGRNDAAFGAQGDRIDLGGQATRLFARSNGSDGSEVEPSYAFGRGLRWWDEHQQQVADYEPQYQRLDQIMRWSGALEWLTHQGTTTLLPAAPAATTATTPEKFKDWYAQHSDLRERAPIPWVTPPTATQESLVPTPSPAFTDCGSVYIEGGVSLSDLYDRTGDTDYRPDLPPDVDRAGLFDATSAYDDASGTGEITELSIDDAGKTTEKVQRTFTTQGDQTTVDIDATGRNVIPMGGVKVWRSGTQDRTVAYSVTAGDHRVQESVAYQGKDLGTLTTADTANIVTVTWRRGVVDRILNTLESIQSKLPGTSDTAPSPATGPLYEVRQPDGTVVERVGGPEDPWLGVSATVPAEGDDLTFLLGGPDRDSGEPKFYASDFAAAPTPPSAAAGYLSVLPAGVGADAVAGFVGAPDPKRPTVLVRTLDGRTSRIVEVGDSGVVPASDPVLGLNGTVEGAALLRDFPAVKQLLTAAAESGDGYLRGVALGGDGVALAGGDGSVILAPSGSDLADRVLRALGPDLQGTAVMQVLRALHGVPQEVRQIGLDTIKQSGRPQTLLLGSCSGRPGSTGSTSATRCGPRCTSARGRSCPRPSRRPSR